MAPSGTITFVGLRLGLSLVEVGIEEPYTLNLFQDLREDSETPTKSFGAGKFGMTILFLVIE